MFCMEDCERQGMGSRPSGFLERVLNRCLSSGKRQARHKSTSTHMPVLEHETTILGRGELFIVDMSGRCEIVCIKGAAWVTRAGRRCDYVLEEGESLLLCGEARIIVSGGAERTCVVIRSNSNVMAKAE